MTVRIVEFARAKVNLGLAVIGRRPNGYHELRSVFLRIGLADRLSGSTDEPLNGDRLAIDGEEDCPVEGNTVLRALKLLRAFHFPLREMSAPLPTLDLRLQKRVPIAAGLGGGSSDGAAAISLAMALWSVTLAERDVVTLSAQLGADVPFFIAGYPAALVSGIGEEIEPLDAAAGEPGLLLVTPIERLSTAAVFAEFDRRPAAPDASHAVDEFSAAFRSGLDAASLAGWALRLRDANDLWAPAVRLLPSLELLRGELERALDRPFLLSGSGSTLFALYASLGEAQEAAGRLSSTGLQQLAGAHVFATGTELRQDAGRMQ